jgi:hypothetical protein
MNATPEFEYTNCCQPEHADGMAAPLQAGVVNKFALSWSEKLLKPLGSVTLVTPVTLSKDPMASDIWPVTLVETSLPLPTVSDRRPPRAGGYGRAGAVVQGSSRHSVVGYEEVKHPFFGRGTRSMPLRQSCRLFADGGRVVAAGGVGPGVCARPSGAAHNAPSTARPIAIIACRGLRFHEFTFGGDLVVASSVVHQHVMTAGL